MKHSSLIIILMVVTLNGAFAQKKTNSFKTWNKNLVIAHRGAWKKNAFPENSIASLNEAIRIGCYGSEFDVHMTSDSVLVVNHDPDFLGLPIEKSTYQELLSKKLSNGESIPTLESYLKAGMKQKTTKLILEIKPSKAGAENDKILTTKVVAMVGKLKAQPWVDYISFSYDILKKVKELQPGANVAYLAGNAPLEKLKQDGFYGADYQYGVYQKGEWFAKAKELGLTINAWTVNGAPEMKWLLDSNIDFITTNEPEMLFELIKSKK
ncbi:MAG: glycerophosphodiester phosphodiesterase family protein [Candidatus Pedobacter colombiensis]|uniref:Glycerophosphodiester phosphodiesterase family protein n=1 Tax=Candidatus Pedobacter colombiensis TaxID=3121371 RepID=A0AAJ6B7A8_9SPHI|nr:glycerophosphodiester phosphodiesterase family protein [Pedobacter sp.]WEK19321.1 MAG: glycerophosphodiester phosphodiesterase family protein [Pedobacter sp.]